MIAWRYIDRAGATVAAICDYNCMRAIINNTPDEIKEVYGKMTAPRSSRITGMPTARNPMAVQDKLIVGLDKLDLLMERYSQAIDYMTWFEPAWSSLTDDEQMILREFYMCGSRKSGATNRLAEALHYSERQIDRLRAQAFTHLQTRLFG